MNFACYLWFATRFHFLFYFGFYKFKVSDFKPVIDYLPLYFRLFDCFAKTIGCMSIAVFINRSSIYKISLSINPDCQVTAFAGEMKLAFPTGGFHGLNFFSCIGFACFCCCALCVD